MKHESAARPGRRSAGVVRPSRRVGRTALVASVCGAAVAASAAVGVATSTAIVPGPAGQIAFESNRDGDNEIFAMNSDGTIERQLTSNAANDVFPAWSPAGDKISFSSDRHQAGNLDVYVMDADGSDPTQLTNSPGDDRGASWTSDGQKVIFHSARNATATAAFDVFVMNADGSDEHPIFSNGSAAYVCGDSINGTIVVNSSGDPLGTNPEGDFEIYTMAIDGSNVQQITSNAVLDSGPKWSPDCSTISFNSTDAGGSLDVFRVGTDGSDLTNLTNAPGTFDAFSAFSPDGSRIVFTSSRDVNFEIYTMSAVDGSDVDRLTFTKKEQADLRADWGTAADYDGPPTDKEQCKQGRWQEFGQPVFADQAACVSLVQEGGA
jgi:Tol biopolymer transport system component